MSSAVVIHVPSVDGHFLEYGRCFAEAAVRVYGQVFVLIPAALATVSVRQGQWWGAEILPYSPGLPTRVGASLAYRHLSDWLGVRRACRRMGRSNLHLVLTFMDAIFTAFVPIAPPPAVTRVFALTMRADIGQHDLHPLALASRPSLARRLKYAMWRRVIGGVRPDCLATNDPCLYELLSSGSRAREGRLLLLPDFSHCHRSRESGHGKRLPPGPMVVNPVVRCLAIGYLDRRKNLSLLLQAALAYRSITDHDLRITLAGTMPPGELDPAGQAALTKLLEQQALVLQPGRQSDPAYQTAVAEADVIWAVYSDHDFASGVMMDAMATGAAVIAQATGVIGHYARSYRRAVVLSAAGGVDVVVEALRQVFDLCVADRASGQAGANLGTPPLDHGGYVDRIANALLAMSTQDVR